MADDTADLATVDSPPPETDDSTARTLARYRRAAIVLAMALVCVVYVASALTYGRSLRSTEDPVGFHAKAADALLDGDAALAPAPPELLALPDPYDPIANYDFRAAGGHDQALFDDNLYTAAGPTTAVLLHIPSRLLGFGNLSPNLATLIAALLGFAAAVGVFGEFRRRHFAALPLWAEITVVFALGLGSPVLWLVSIGRSYESAIACGYMLVAAGAYFLLRGLRDVTNPTGWSLALGGASIAAAVGARPSLIVASLFVTATAFVVVTARATGQRYGTPLVYLLGPWVFVGALVALYNYVRFDSFTEFGTNYQLAGMNMREYPGFEAGYVLPNLVDYLLLKPRFEATWPYVWLRENTFVDDPTRHTREPVAGLLWLFPYVTLGLAVTIARGRVMFTTARSLAWTLLVGFAFAIGVALAVAFPFNASTMRYLIDFAPTLAVIAAVGWAWNLGRSEPGSGARRFLAGSWAVAVGYSAAVGVALVLTPCLGTGSC